MTDTPLGGEPAEADGAGFPDAPGRPAPPAAGGARATGDATRSGAWDTLPPNGADAPGDQSGGEHAEGRTAERARRDRRIPWERLRDPEVWRRGRVPAVLTVALALLTALHFLVPDSPGHLGSLWETLLPWAGLVVPVAALAALVRRSASAALAGLLMAAVWTGTFGDALISAPTAVEPNLTVLTHNVGAATADPAATARGVLAAEPDVVALEEVTWETRPVYDGVLGAELPHSVHEGTVGLWSRYPVTESGPVDLGLGWVRALRARVDGPGGGFAVYAVHLASVRVGPSGFAVERRNRTVEALAEAVGDEPLDRVVLMGDLNGSTGDRALEPLTSQLSSVQGAAGTGFGFSWPARFPVARIDHILTRGVTPVRSWSLPPTGSDHLPVAARLRV